MNYTIRFTPDQNLSNLEFCSKESGSLCQDYQRSAWAGERFFFQLMGGIDIKLHDGIYLSTRARIAETNYNWYSSPEDPDYAPLYVQDTFKDDRYVLSDGSIAAPVKIKGFKYKNNEDSKHRDPDDLDLNSFIFGVELKIDLFKNYPYKRR